MQLASRAFYSQWRVDEIFLGFIWSLASASDECGRGELPINLQNQFFFNFLPDLWFPTPKHDYCDPYDDRDELNHAFDKNLNLFHKTHFYLKSVQKGWQKMWIGMNMTTNLCMILFHLSHLDINFTEQELSLYYLLSKGLFMQFWIWVKK
jgi:hypothetical protein